MNTSIISIKDSTLDINMRCIIMAVVFVYGSLMKGYWNHKYLENSDFIGYATLDGYGIYHVSSFPGIVPRMDHYVLGEVYNVNESTMRALDILEDEGDMYVRKEETVRVGDKNIKCFVYVWNREIKPGFKKVESKPWKPRGR